MKSSNKFFASLEPGQLVFASNINAKKYHIITLENSAYEDDVEAIKRLPYPKSRKQKKIDEIDDSRKNMWRASALCGTKGEHAFYGNYTRYYWRPHEFKSLNGVCQGCLKEWRKQSEPEIVGYDRTAKPEDAWPWELPFGWRELPAESHPWDVPKDGDIELVKDDTGKVVGEHRVELRRFVRGPRIVRLVRHFDEDTYSARYWTIDGDVDDEHFETSGTFLYARQSCHELMARGGY